MMPNTLRLYRYLYKPAAASTSTSSTMPPTAAQVADAMRRFANLAAYMSPAEVEDSGLGGAGDAHHGEGEDGDRGGGQPADAAHG